MPDTELRTAIASMIVGAIYSGPDEAVGPATLAERQRGLRLADDILAMVSLAMAREIERRAPAPRRRCLHCEAGSALHDDGVHRSLGWEIPCRRAE